ncbi:RcpC/CpaB family pilus assembly protein [Streptomyces chengmaiensis]|uniref:RcpC/CpaB family pilus assembly protein n=1 Tax=Streptomyces chengmaiensis TaxID=3040919 RepID=UPI0029622635|nr:RcpC/CpaB family pilus assembly protein [Streptomyces chengmaiensis]
MPPFAPLRVRGGRQRLRRALLRRRRALAAGLAVTAAALAASSAHGLEGTRSPAGTGADAKAAAAAAHSARSPVQMVSAPVRIADAATVRLLRPGDRVDVIASALSPAGEASEAHIVASGARVAEVPRPEQSSAASAASAALPPSSGGGALVVLTVPRPVAAELAGAGATSRLAVTVC